MNQPYKATLSQYALPQFLPTWGGKGGVIWGDLEECSLKTMMFEKYPSISPYTYCANNPMKYVDPTGKEVEHTTFKDKVTTFFARIFNAEFRQNYKILKKSEETYVFKGYEGVETGEFTTDGNKLYINYNFNKSKKQGTNAYTNLRHETEHGVQFEYGEIGFDNQGRVTPNGTPDWTSSATKFDIIDEYGAREAGYNGTTLNSDPNKNVRNSWLYGGHTKEEKINHLKQSEAYKDLPIGPVNNQNITKIKTSTQYMLPYKPRQQ
jgi:hypothetical protein